MKGRQGRLGDTWYLDQVFVTINGKRQYLWCAVDQDGDVIDILVQPRRDGRAARRVADAAIMLGAMEGDVPDPNDPAMDACTPPPGRDYTAFLNPDGLNGARIGIPRAFYYDAITLNGEDRPRGGLNREQTALIDEAIAILESQGAIIVDPANVPSYADPDPNNNFSNWNHCAGLSQGKGGDETCTVNFKYGMKRDFDIWLGSLGPSAPVGTLTEVLRWNLDHAAAGTPQVRTVAIRHIR